MLYLHLLLVHFTAGTWTTTPAQKETIYICGFNVNFTCHSIIVGVSNNITRYFRAFRIACARDFLHRLYGQGLPISLMLGKPWPQMDGSRHQFTAQGCILKLWFSTVKPEAWTCTLMHWDAFTPAKQIRQVKKRINATGSDICMLQTDKSW